jgi:hypothetical protein
MLNKYFRPAASPTASDEESFQAVGKRADVWAIQLGVLRIPNATEDTVEGVCRRFNVRQKRGPRIPWMEPTGQLLDQIDKYLEDMQYQVERVWEIGRNMARSWLSDLR